MFWGLVSNFFLLKKIEDAKCEGMKKGSFCSPFCVWFECYF